MQNILVTPPLPGDEVAVSVPRTDDREYLKPEAQIHFQWKGLSCV